MHIESFLDVPILSTAGRGIDFLFLFKREMSRAGASRIWYFFSVEKDLVVWLVLGLVLEQILSFSYDNKHSYKCCQKKAETKIS